MTTQEKALAILDGIDAITDRDMLVFGFYKSSEVVDPKLAQQGAICGGHTACLMGSMFIAAKAKRRRDEYGYLMEPWESDKPLRADIAVAYRALNEAAKVSLARMDEVSREAIEDSSRRDYVHGGEPSLAESLFECESSLWFVPTTMGQNYWRIRVAKGVTKRRVKSLTKRARQIIEAQA